MSLQSDEKFLAESLQIPDSTEPHSHPDPILCKVEDIKKGCWSNVVRMWSLCGPYMRLLKITSVIY